MLICDQGQPQAGRFLSYFVHDREGLPLLARGFALRVSRIRFVGGTAYDQGAPVPVVFVVALSKSVVEPIWLLFYPRRCLLFTFL